jgi:hypothetical protein
LNLKMWLESCHTAFKSETVFDRSANRKKEKPTNKQFQGQCISVW